MRLRRTVEAAPPSTRRTTAAEGRPRMQADSQFHILTSSGAEARDTSRPVMLVGFHEQANLGPWISWLPSLREQGYRVEVFDIEADPDTILAAALELEPVLVGFSLIFQFYVDRYGALMRQLRQHGIGCHFTMGGHFPSLSYQHTLELAAGTRFGGQVRGRAHPDRAGGPAQREVRSGGKFKGSLTAKATRS